MEVLQDRRITTTEQIQAWPKGWLRAAIDDAEKRGLGVEGLALKTELRRRWLEQQRKQSVRNAPGQAMLRGLSFDELREALAAAKEQSGWSPRTSAIQNEFRRRLGKFRKSHRG